MSTSNEPDSWSPASEVDVDAAPHQAYQPHAVPAWSRRTRWIAGSLATAGLTAGLAVGGATWAGASSAAPVVTPVASSASADTPDDKKAPGHWFGGWFGGPAGALHGQLVVPKSGGGYETVDVQRGEVTAVSEDALTVRSEDGYTKSYVIGADTLVNGGRDGIGSIEKAEQVAVMASGGGDKPTAVNVVDLAARQSFHERWGWNWRGHRPAD